VVIDSPSYSLWVARLVRLIDRTIPIVDYVSPSVWAWRPGRAKSMRRYVDHVLALLPFEPDVHRRLGGPPCTYVGHPLTDEVAQLRPNAQEAERRRAKPPIILALPGSRSGEVTRLTDIFGQTLGIVAERVGPIEARPLHTLQNYPREPDRLADALSELERGDWQVQKLNWRSDLATPYWSAVMRQLTDRVPQESPGHSVQLADGPSR